MAETEPVPNVSGAAAKNPISSADAIAAVVEKSHQLRTLDVWYRVSWKDNFQRSSVEHLVWDLASGRYRIEQYLLKAPKSNVVATLFIQTISDGRCVMLDQTAASDGEISIDQNEEKHTKGFIFSSGFIIDSARRMPVNFQDWDRSSPNGKNMFDALVSTEVSVKESRENDKPVWTLVSPAIEITVAFPQLTCTKACQYAFLPKDGARGKVSERIISSYINKNGVAIPSEFSIEYYPVFPGRQGYKTLVSVLPNLLKVNEVVTDKIIVPHFPVGTYVCDDLKQTKYTVSSLDEIDKSAASPADVVNETLKKAQEKKDGNH